ncbi:MAG: hypothetical protein BGO67_03660 [Alphaproteobacteria bacterium 41-28]|nr:MAG: hypothetical protein BGO67_03660 [Alphaproteobacteria bacterium 41-28]
MDGTLFDNDVLYDLSIEKTFQMYNLSLPVVVPRGTSLESYWDIILQHNSPPPISYRQWAEQIHISCSSLLSKEHIRLGITATLKKISEANIPQTCVSNTESKTIKKNFAKTGLKNFFAHIVGRDNVLTGKPTPIPYLKACEINRRLPSECIAIEDSETGIISAKEAGLNVIAYPNKNIKNCGFSKADFIITHATEVLEILDLNYLKFK